MSARNTTVALSKAEKERLDEISRTIFETTEVPYGRVITELIDEFEKNRKIDRREAALA